MGFTMRSTYPQPDDDRHPYCVLWTPIPVVSWFLPILGHVAISTSDGVIRDFAGSYFVREDMMAFGAPTKYWRLNMACVKYARIYIYDEAIKEASLEYCGRMYMIRQDNCHSFIAYALNEMGYDGQKWTAFKVWYHVLLYSRYLSVRSWFKTWFPFLLMCLTISLIVALCVILKNLSH